MIIDLRRHPWLSLLALLLVSFFDPEKWAVWEYSADITNDGVNSGTHAYVFTPGEGNNCILIAGLLGNDDGSSRTGQVTIRDEDNLPIRQILFAAAMAAGAERNFPTSEDTGDNISGSDGTPVIFAGNEDLYIDITAIAVSQDTKLSVTMLVSGGPPTVVLTSPTDATETETSNRVQ